MNLPLARMGSRPPGAEYGPGSDSTSHTTTLTELRVTKTVDLETGDPYDELQYTITVSNDGPSFFTYAFYLSGNGCEDLQSDSATGYPTGYPTYLGPGESVTFGCRHTFNPGSGEGQDPDPYVNEACVYAWVQNSQLDQVSTQKSRYDLVVCDDASTALARHNVSGTVFEDMNADGARQLGEPPLPGVVVYADKNGNGVRDEGEPDSTSDGQGNRTIRLKFRKCVRQLRAPRFTG